MWFFVPPCYQPSAFLSVTTYIFMINYNMTFLWYSFGVIYFCISKLFVIVIVKWIWYKLNKIIYFSFEFWLIFYKFYIFRYQLISVLTFIGRVTVMVSMVVDMILPLVAFAWCGLFNEFPSIERKRGWKTR